MLYSHKPKAFDSWPPALQYPICHWCFGLLCFWRNASTGLTKGGIPVVIPLSALRFSWHTQFLQCLDSLIIIIETNMLRLLHTRKFFSSLRCLLECLQKGIRMASWGEWMKVWMNFSLRKWQKWIQSKFKFNFFKNEIKIKNPSW